MSEPTKDEKALAKRLNNALTTSLEHMPEADPYSTAYAQSVARELMRRDDQIEALRQELAELRALVAEVVNRPTPAAGLTADDVVRLANVLRG